jgi:hypothetical protein
MSKKVSTKTNVSVPRSGRLRETCFKLRGLAYLIEQCGDHPAPPLDEGEAFFGVSLIMNDIHGEVLGFARSVEQWEIRRAQRRAEKSGKSSILTDETESKS